MSTGLDRKVVVIVSKHFELQMQENPDLAAQVQALVRKHDYPDSATETNSPFLSESMRLAFFYPGSDLVSLCKLLWRGTHLMFLWAGGPVMKEVVEAAVRMRPLKRILIYTLSPSLQVERAYLSNIMEKS